mmetsp:Transcript_17209/g.34495  ORF Transcript_17209/g.34495 Transcript_17209/m.34495 type:complete len:273 (-) Transcript_17209:1062-1880(-)
MYHGTMTGEHRHFLRQDMDQSACNMHLKKALVTKKSSQHFCDITITAPNIITTDINVPATIVTTAFVSTSATKIIVSCSAIIFKVSCGIRGGISTSIVGDSLTEGSIGYHFSLDYWSVANVISSNVSAIHYSTIFLRHSCLICTIGGSTIVLISDISVSVAIVLASPSTKVIIVALSILDARTLIVANIGANDIAYVSPDAIKQTWLEHATSQDVQKGQIRQIAHVASHTDLSSIGGAERVRQIQHRPRVAAIHYARCPNTGPQRSNKVVEQ